MAGCEPLALPLRGSALNGRAAANGARDAHERLLRALDAHGFDDAIARAPSALPGWTVAHVITHLARNADSHTRMIEGVVRGEPVVQYAGGAEQRASDIEAGSTRDAQTLLDDLRAADDAMAAAFACVDDTTWTRAALRGAEQEWPAFDLPFLRWREVALHATDLGFDNIDSDMWHADYVEHELRRQVGALGARLETGAVVHLVATDADWSTFVLRRGDGPVQPVAEVAGTARELLAWLVGRSSDGADRPALAPWTGLP